MPVPYYNKKKKEKTSTRYDPLEKPSKKDTDVTEETGSAGDTDAPGAPMPGDEAETGAEEILENDKKKGK